MTLYLAIIAAFNVALGFALAWYLRRRWWILVAAADDQFTQATVLPQGVARTSPIEDATGGSDAIEADFDDAAPLHAARSTPLTDAAESTPAMPDAEAAQFDCVSDFSASDDPLADLAAVITPKQA